MSPPSAHARLPVFVVERLVLVVTSSGLSTQLLWRQTRLPGHANPHEPQLALSLAVVAQYAGSAPTAGHCV